MASRYSVDQSASAGGGDARIGRLHRLVAAHRAAGVEQHGDQRLEVGRRHRAVDQQRLRRAADAGAPHLGVQHHLLRGLQVGGLVDIDVADALQVREHRHPRLGLHPRHQPLAAARHDDVDGATQAGQHGADRGAVAGGHQLDGVGGQAGLLEAAHQGAMDGGGRAQAFGAAAQDGGVAGLEAQRAGVGGDVGPALIDHADHPDRHPHPLDGEAVGPGPGRQHRADRVLEPGDHVEPGGDGLDPRRGRAPAGRGTPCRRRRFRAAAMSSALAVRMASASARTATAMAFSASSLRGPGVSARVRAAARARRPMPSIRASRSAPASAVTSVMAKFHQSAAVAGRCPITG